MWCNGTKIYMFLSFFYLYRSYLLGGLGAKMWWKTFDQSRTVIWTLFLKKTKWWENFYTIWCSIHKTDKMYWMSIATTIKKERICKEKERFVKSWKFDNPRNGEGWWLPFYNSIDFSISVFLFFAEQPISNWLITSKTLFAAILRDKMSTYFLSGKIK